MSKVERAIIMAAGKGTRMRPLTFSTPKPLIKVNGKRMIDTVIEGLHENGIYEIYVVVGYHKEYFDSLVSEYGGVKLIENPYYDTCNNISSLYVAREHIDNAIILDGDQIIYNNKILRTDFDCSGYNCVWTPGKTNEWLLDVRNNTIQGCKRNGGTRGWQLFSISRWTVADARKLRKELEIEFMEKHNDQIYWDDVPIFLYPDQYQLGIMEMESSDLAEVDSIEELVKLDSSYSK